MSSSKSAHAEINCACEKHFYHLVDSVLDKIRNDADLILHDKEKKLARLRNLWSSNFLGDGSVRVDKKHSLHSPRIPVAKHPKLLEVVPKIPSVGGCIGMPADFMKRPMYVNKPQKMKSATRVMRQVPLAQNASATTIEAITTIADSLCSPNGLNFSDLQQQHQKGYRAVVSDSFDLLIGMKVSVCLSQLLGSLVDIMASSKSNNYDLNMNNEEDVWVDGWVVRISKSKSDKSGTNKLQIKLRFANGAELYTHWPNNSNVRRMAEKQVNADAVRAQGGSGGADIARCGEGEVETGADKALRILLDGDSDNSENEGGGGCSDSDSDSGNAFLKYFLSDNSTVGANIGADTFNLNNNSNFNNNSTHTADHRQIYANRSSLGGNSGNSDSAYVVRVLSGLGVSDSTFQQHAALAESLSEQGAGEQAMTLLATGERVPPAQLEEIERKFHPGYRPCFILNPTQSTGSAGMHGGRSVRRSFVSRQWTKTPNTTSTTSAHNITNSTSIIEIDAESANDANTGAGSGSGDDEGTGWLQLSAEEDPTQPLPDPDVVIIGRAVKRFRRLDDVWSVALMDVYVRDLRGGNSSGDLIVPRVAVQLRTHFLLPKWDGAEDKENVNLLIQLLH